MTTDMAWLLLGGGAPCSSSGGSSSISVDSESCACDPLHAKPQLDYPSPYHGMESRLPKPPITCSEAGNFLIGRTGEHKHDENLDKDPRSHDRWVLQAITPS